MRRAGRGNKWDEAPSASGKNSPRRHFFGCVWFVLGDVMVTIDRTSPRMRRFENVTKNQRKVSERRLLSRFTITGACNAALYVHLCCKNESADDNKHEREEALIGLCPYWFPCLADPIFAAQMYSAVNLDRNRRLDI